MRIHYLFDPLCGWCYGAVPALQQLVQLYGVEIHFAPTGLFAGENAHTLNASFAEFAWQNDQRIARLTGQIFSEVYRVDVLGASGALFDSAPATLGIIAAAATDEKRELEVLMALQRARYVEGRDNAKLSVVAEVLAELGLEEASRRVLSPDEDLLKSYNSRISAARGMMRQIGAQGVPAIVVEDERGMRVVPSSLLYGEFSALQSGLRAA